MPEGREAREEGGGDREPEWGTMELGSVLCFAFGWRGELAVASLGANEIRRGSGTYLMPSAPSFKFSCFIRCKGSALGAGICYPR